MAFSVSNLGPKSYQKLVNKFGNPKKAWEGDRSKYYELSIKDKTYASFDEFRKEFDIEDYVSKLKKEKVEFISFLDKEYPESLKKFENPPIGLYCKGNLGLLDPSLSLRMTRIAVVGTRRITEYGKNVTENIVSELVNNNVVIVSGLALGVDAKAHRTTIKNNGMAIAVLACGVDCCTPSENYSLYNDILKNNGLIISEYPLSLPPNKGTFLARNRIVAALSDGVLITEATIDSGSLVTAEFGLQLEKKVFAVPGPITSKMSDGSLKLLKQGATLVTEAQDILKEFKEQSSKIKVKLKNQRLKNLGKEEKIVVELLEVEAMTIDEIAKKAKLKPNILMGIISGLELKGIVKNVGGKINLIK